MKRKGIQVNSMIKDAKAAEWGYILDGKKVSEFKFMKSLIHELRGKETKKYFYWTDKKVMECFKLLGIKITPQILVGIKRRLSNP